MPAREGHLEPVLLDLEEKMREAARALNQSDRPVAYARVGDGDLFAMTRCRSTTLESRGLSLIDDSRRVFILLWVPQGRRGPDDPSGERDETTVDTGSGPAPLMAPPEGGSADTLTTSGAASGGEKAVEEPMSGGR